jgi:hypothetical protein
MLRLTLSEHFMSAVNLLTQIDSAQSPSKPPVKKKSLKSAEPAKPPVDAGLFNSQDNTPASSPSAPQPALTDSLTLESITENFQGIVNTIKTSHPAVAGFLISAFPASLNGSVLTLAFPASARLALDMCQKKNDQLNSSFSLALGADIKLKFEIDSNNSKKKPSHVPGARMAQKEKNKVLTDPTVRTFLKGLNAAPIEIERMDAD